MQTGGCMCGGVRWELDEPPVGAAYCHCTRCQRRTGSASSASALTKPGSVRVVQGNELVKSWTPDDGYTKVFCSECGSQLWSHHPDTPDTLFVRLGSFDEDPGVRPGVRQFVDYAAAWEPIPDDGLPRHPERRPTA